VALVEGVEGAAETRFLIAQQDVDPAELGEIIGMTATCHDSGVAAACTCNGAEAGQPIRECQAKTEPAQFSLSLDIASSDLPQ
jgi:hypothetical protein